MSSPAMNELREVARTRRRWDLHPVTTGFITISTFFISIYALGSLLNVMELEKLNVPLAALWTIFAMWIAVRHFPIWFGVAFIDGVRWGIYKASDSPRPEGFTSLIAWGYKTYLTGVFATALIVGIAFSTLSIEANGDLYGGFTFGLLLVILGLPLVPNQRLFERMWDFSREWLVKWCAIIMVVFFFLPGLQPWNETAATSAHRAWVRGQINIGKKLNERVIIIGKKINIETAKGTSWKKALAKLEPEERADWEKAHRNLLRRFMDALREEAIPSWKATWGEFTDLVGVDPSSASNGAAKCEKNFSDYLNPSQERAAKQVGRVCAGTYQITLTGAYLLPAFKDGKRVTPVKVSACGNNLNDAGKPYYVDIDKDGLSPPLPDKPYGGAILQVLGGKSLWVCGDSKIVTFETDVDILLGLNVHNTPPHYGGAYRDKDGTDIPAVETGKIGYLIKPAPQQMSKK